MNPLLQHPTLQHLPYGLLKNPNLEGIKNFLSKRARSMKRLKYIFIALTAFQLANVLMFSKLGGMSSIVQLVMVIVFPALAIGTHLQQKRCSMSDEEIGAIIERHGANAAQQNGY